MNTDHIVIKVNRTWFSCLPILNLDAYRIHDQQNRQMN
jgi:hypothetical protein